MKTPRGQSAPGLRGAGAAAAVALALGGLSLSAVAAVPAGATAGRTTKTVVVKTVSVSQGKVLASGRTLYTVKPSSTPCTAACLKVWPALVLPKGVTKATAGSGVNKAKLGTTTRAGGVRQVTYNGKPLYFFVGDTGPGQVHGDVTDTWGTYRGRDVKGDLGRWVELDVVDRRQRRNCVLGTRVLG